MRQKKRKCKAELRKVLIMRKKKKCFPSVNVVFDIHKTTKANKRKKASIHVQVCYERKCAYFPTGIRVYPDQYRDGRIIGSQETIRLNAAIDELKARIWEYYDQCEKDDKPFTLSGLKADFKEEEEKAKDGSFLDFFYQRIYEKGISEGTRKAYLSVYNQLEKWGQIRTFADLTTANIYEWDRVAREHAKKDKFVYSYHKFLKSIINDAVKQDKITKNPYNNFKIARSFDIKHDYLAEDELQRFIDVELEDDSLIRARDLFIFCTYTGLSFVDAKKFDFADCTKTNGKYRYTSIRQKSGERFMITLLKPAMAVLKRNDYKLPNIDAHIYNRSLKTIAQLAKVRKTITSHCARVTFASTIAGKHDIPLEITAYIMGHANIRQTRAYMKLQQPRLDRILDALDDKL